MTLEEKNLNYTTIEENLDEPSTELLKYHPEGKVPLLIHKGAAIHESAIITEYLDESFPATRLMPSSPLLKAQLRMWTYWCNHIFKVDLDLFKYEMDGLKVDEKTHLIERIQGHLNKLETALENSKFLMGDELSLCDIHIFPFYRQLQKARPDFAELFRPERVNHWLDQIIHRPSFEKVMKKNI